ncbi:hypothetical protein V8D89_008674 [Ganoderma adspersum]
MLGRSNCNHPSRTFLPTHPPSPLHGRPPSTPFTSSKSIFPFVTHARSWVPSRDPTRTASFGHGHTYMAHSVHTPPASRTPQSIRRLLLPLGLSPDAEICTLPDACPQFQVPSSEFQAPAATPRARTFLGARQLQKLPLPSPSPLLRFSPMTT